MPDNTNVNNSSAVVVVGRTAPVPPGQQKSDKSIPVVIANDQATIPVAEQNKVQSEVALSLLGIPRAEVALGIFADVNTYDVNPTEWTSEPEQFASFEATEPGYTSPTSGNGAVPGIQDQGLSHVPAESGALIEAPADKTAVLTSKRFFRYQPGRVSAATFGVKTSIINDAGGGATSGSVHQPDPVSGSPVANQGVKNPCVRKYGIFDKYDGYYWETRNNGEGDNFCVVRRTQSIAYKNALDFGSGTGDQTEDYGTTNPPDPAGKRGSESLGYANYGEGGLNEIPVSELTPPAYPQSTPFGQTVIVRDNLLMTHAGVYDPSLLQPEHKAEISKVSAGSTNPTFEFDVNSGIAVSISNAVYNELDGLMTITTNGPHGFADGKYITLAGIAMTCRFSYSNRDGTGTLDNSRVKFYPNNRREYNIIEVPSATTFRINVGVSTVPTFYHTPAAGKPNGWVVGLSTNQHVSYSKGPNVGIITGLTDTQIYKVRAIGINTTSGITTATFNTFDRGSAGGTYNDITISAGEKQLLRVGSGSNGVDAITGISSHYMVTPVPFIQPMTGDSVASGKAAYLNIKTNEQKATSQGTGMFPYLYKAADNTEEGYIDTKLDTTNSTELPTFKGQIDAVNNYYPKWVNQNVSKDYWNVYEYRIPRSRFSGDRLDNVTDNLLYSDSVATNPPGTNVLNPDTGELVTDTSIWDLAFDKVTMYKIEFSWYGAVGALFLAYVPVSSGEARWVRVHHLRASNQLKIASLGNATLPITYMVYGGGSADRFGYKNTARIAGDFSNSEHIVKYGASYYIDGGDRGTVKLYSHATPGDVEVYGSKRTLEVGSTSTTTRINVTSATNNDTTGPFIDLGTTCGINTTYYIGSRVETGNILDQNVRITYIHDNKAYLNTPLNSDDIPGNTIDITPNRPTPLLGLKCRDFIQSSLGINVRNRTQVYPTRMSTGSTGLLKVDFRKSPVFQTTSLISGTAGGPTIGAEVDIGKRGKPTKVDVPINSYGGTHEWNAAGATLTNAVERESGSGFTNGTTIGISSAFFDSSTGKMTITTASAHSIVGGDTIRLLKGAFAFTCSLDDNATVHTYPREIDPIFDGDACNASTFGGTIDGNYSRPITCLQGTTGSTIIVSVTNATTSGTAPNVTASNVASAAEYIRDSLGPNNGTWGWFRGYFAPDTTKKPISVFGYLENRGMDRTKNIAEDGYYFSAYDSTVDSVKLSADLPFVREENSIAKDGEGTTSAVTEFTKEGLSSVKISPQVRAPIPDTGTIVASVYAPASGQEFDLSPYFDYNKDYLSFPLTDKIESLYVCASSQGSYHDAGSNFSNSAVGINTVSISASLTWEEQ